MPSRTGQVNESPRSSGGSPGRESLAGVSFPIPDRPESRQFAVEVEAWIASGPIDASTRASVDYTGLGLELKLNVKNTIDMTGRGLQHHTRRKFSQGLSCALKLSS
jgi:hypothetical protein